MRLHVVALWTVAFGFFWEQNRYFGWNRLPQSDAELIADGVTCLLFGVALWAAGQGS